jgi:RNA polymerase sigma-70 factor (ECF subfamily)
VVETEDDLQRAREGDLDAFNRLVLEHQGIVYGVCLRQLGSPQAAEDAAQEAFIAAWRGLSGLRGPFRPWLLRIAVNACTDELRRRGRRPASSLELALDEGVPDPPDDDPSPESEALNSELRGRIEAALRLLPEEQALAVHLCDVEGLDYAEIAATMGTSVGTVKSRIARGRARLRQVLLEEPELLPDRLRHTGKDDDD